MAFSKTKEKTGERFLAFLEGWYDNNLFNNNLVDATLYLVFYIALPVIITIVTLETSVDSVTNRAYCYFSILISALNALYDIYNRWDCADKSIKNTKLVIMGIAFFGVVLYCVFAMTFSLQSQGICKDTDGFLCIFFISTFVSIVDVFVAFSRRMAFRNTI